MHTWWGPEPLTGLLADPSSPGEQGRAAACLPGHDAEHMTEPEIQRLLRRQAGVVSRRQVLAAGGSPALIERRLRRREWVRLHTGIFVDHTGRPSRSQREWAALLRHPGSVLAGRSSLRADGFGSEPARGDPVELAVPHGRHLRRQPGLRVWQLRDFGRAARTSASPPRLRVENAALMVASAARSEDAAVAVLADVVRAGATTPARLSAVLEEQLRLPRRSLLLEVLTDVAAGAESPLEMRYLRDVERAHGLLRGHRQVREIVQLVRDEPLRRVVRDVRYAAHAALVELDGDLWHGAALDRWADLTRDLEAAVNGDATLRAGWQQVLDPCRLALVVGGVLRARGWSGAPHPCADAVCAVARAQADPRPECA